MLKKLFIAATTTLGLIMLVDVNPAQAASLTTTFSSNNGYAGNMFDVTTFGKELTVTGLDINVSSSSSLTVNLYTKSGTYVGAQNNPSAWTLVSTNILNSNAGRDNPTFVDVTDFVLLAESVTAFYIDVGRRINYTNGTAPGHPIFSNDDLSIATGIGKAPNFGTNFTPRTWNGTIYYEPASTPEPASLLGLFGIGALALTSLKCKYQEKV